MNLIQEYNNWLKKVNGIRLSNNKFRIYSLHDKSVENQNDLVDDDGIAFIFVFSSDDVAPFTLGLPLSVLQDSDDFLKFSNGELETYRELILHNFPSGDIWGKVDEDYIEKTERFLGDILTVINKASEFLAEEIDSNEELN